MKASYEEVERLHKLYNNLIDCGVTPKNVRYYETPNVYSGYSMGETVEVWCNNKIIEAIDHTSDYARSCRWRAKHGKVVINFSKKSLKEYLKACIDNDYQARLNISNENLDKKRSIIKG